MWQEKLHIVSFGRKCNFRGGSNVGMVVTFVVVESSIRISFVIICFGLHKKNSNCKKTTFFYELNMCFDQTSFDVNGDYGGTHIINDICMKI